MAEQPAATPIPDIDADQVEAIAQYLGLTPETIERLQLLREQVTVTLNAEFGIVAGDLNQLRSILSDAATKLSGTFRVVTASSDDLRRTIINPTAASVPPMLGSEQLDGMFAKLEDYRTRLAHGTRKVVHQQSLESGDIELF